MCHCKSACLSARLHICLYLSICLSVYVYLIGYVFFCLSACSQSLGFKKWLLIYPRMKSFLVKSERRWQGRGGRGEGGGERQLEFEISLGVAHIWWCGHDPSSIACGSGCWMNVWYYFSWLEISLVFLLKKKRGPA